MATVQVKWYGDKLIGVIKDATPDALFDGGELLVERAKQGIQTKSGDLAASGYVKSAKRSTYQKLDVSLPEADVSGETVAAGFSAFYAKMVENGHVLKRGKRTVGSVAARPFLRPAMDHFRDDIAKRIVAKYRERIK